MAGNTRGKLKEHFEGIHRNFDWCMHHISTSLVLISSQLTERERQINPELDDEAIRIIVEDYPLYKGIVALGEGIQTLDELAQQVYATL